MLGTSPTALSSGAFNFAQEVAVEFDKPFRSYQEQIQLLKKRGLIIQGEDFALSALNTISYYDLINRYKRYFMFEDDTFRENVSIEYLYNFFLFDKEIQSFIMKYSILVENIFKTKLSYTLAENFGVDVGGYLNKYNYDSSSKGSLTYLDVQCDIMKWLCSNQIKNPTKFYKNTHNHIPPWILFKNITLGSAINLFDFLKGDPKYECANALIPQDMSYDQKLNFILCSMNAIRDFRNCVAHNLHFTSLRIPKKYSISPSIMWSLIREPLLERNKKKVTKDDRHSLNGLYGAMLSIMVFLYSPYLVSTFIQDFLLILNKESAYEEMYLKYAKITDMPLNIKERFINFFQQQFNYQ